MANKDVEVLDKKSLEKYRKEIKEDFEKNYKEVLVKDLSDQVQKEVSQRFNRELKEQIVEEVTVDIKDEIKNQIYKEEKKLSAGKSFKIFRLSIYILVLLAIVGYVAYRLYVTDNIDLVRYDYVPQTTEKTTTVVNPEEKKETPVDYKALYGNMLDHLKIYDYSLYKTNATASELTMVQKIQMAYSTLSESDFEVDGSIITIKSTTLRSAYIKLFGTDDYEATSFSIYNINYVYSVNKNEYIAIVSSENTEDVQYEVYDAGIDGDNIYVKAYAAKVQNGRLYNLRSGRMIGYSSNKLSDYGNRLSTVVIRFNQDKNFYSITNE